LGRILIYTVVVLLATTAACAEARTVFVFPFENLSNDRSLDWIGEGIAELIVEKLQSEPGLYVFSREERLDAYDNAGIPETAILSRATELKLGWDGGADWIIAGRFSGTAEDFQIAARVVDLELSGASKETEAKGKLEDVIPLTNTVSWDLLRKIAPGTSILEEEYMARPPTPLSAFENYIRGILSSDPQKRVEFLQTAIRLHPQYMAAMFQLGRTLYLERDLRTSNQWMEKVSGPGRPQAHLTMGLNYFYIGDYTRSIATFRELPQTYDVLLNLGSALSLRGDHAAATAAWRQAAETDPFGSDAFFNIGYASFVKGDLDAAVKNLIESLKLRGRDSEALFLLGSAYERQGRIDESQRIIAQATRLSQRVERWLTQPIPRLERLSTTAMLTKSNEIWTDARLARRARGQNVTSWLESIQNKIDSNLYGEVIRELQDVIRVFPDSSEARSLLDEVNQRRYLR
jgi:tetratricopeptide (TPR) repeat protein